VTFIDFPDVTEEGKMEGAGWAAARRAFLLLEARDPMLQLSLQAAGTDQGTIGGERNAQYRMFVCPMLNVRQRLPAR
jgi:hypothetical protein